MHTPDKNFKIKRATKSALSLTKFTDAHARGAWRRAMINAQLSEEAAQRAALKSKDKAPGGLRHSKEGVALD
jgi:hypothetical protein